MKTQCATVAILFLAASLFESCADDGTETMPLKPQPLVLTVEPDSGRIGSIVAIHSDRINVLTTYHTVGFPGADDQLIPDSSSPSSIFTFVPFGARSGALSVFPWFSAELFGLTGKFSVTEAVDTLALTVARYDISAILTANDSSVIDRMGIRRTWRADRQGNAIHISRGYSTGEEYYEYHLVLIDQGTTQLPRPVALWTYVAPDYPSSRTDTIRVGILKIKEFNTSGIISGRFFGEPSIYKMRNGTFAFWVDLRR